METTRLSDEEYEFLERCAIKEFDGNIPREEAERQAREERLDKQSE